MADVGHRIEAAEVVLPCTDLHATLAFFVDRLGFRLDAIVPADDPAAAVLSGHGLRVRLERGADALPGVLRLLTRGGAWGPAELVAPNGTRIVLAECDPPPPLPEAQASFELTRTSDGAAWRVGRAGMLYRDLVPDRQGGRLVASHIRIPDGGPVPDQVHFHVVRFQAIFCRRGWVRLVYEDQGPPFVLREGDCVLQPPRIRHRVLECSPGLEVVEVACPAEHETRIDHDLALPTPRARPERDFDGQRFVRHVAAGAAWRPSWRAGFEARDSGIAAATGGLAGVSVVRPAGTAVPRESGVDPELLFLFVLRGGCELRCDGRAPEVLAEGDAVAVPAGLRHALAACSGDLELLEVALAGTPS